MNAQLIIILLIIAFFDLRLGVTHGVVVGGGGGGGATVATASRCVVFLKLGSLFPRVPGWGRATASSLISR